MKKVRFALSLAILVLTVFVFVRYIQTNPEVIRQLRAVNLVYVLLIMVLYLGIIASLTIVNTISVRLCGKKIGKRESFNLTSTSSIANFFGPLQSGVGIRAVYFKTKLGIPIKQYGLASLYYYGMYAFFSGVFLLFGNAAYRLPLLASLIIGIAATVLYIRKKSQAPTAKKTHVSWELIAKLTGIVLLQLSLITTIYYFELLALGKTVSLGQIISYSGAANFSVFVAITPGAIGIREAFLVFSENLHHISRDLVVAANILDRGIYVIFLGLLFIWLITTHTRVRIKARSEAKNTPDLV